MPKTIAIVGPPGTGKTSAAMTVTKDCLKRGAASSEIAYLTFTKAAADEGKSRVLTDEVGFGLVEEDFPFFRTIHSLAYRGLMQSRKEKPKLVSQAHMRKFSQLTGFDGTFVVKGWEDLADAYQRLDNGGRSEWDQCLDAYAYSRISARTQDELQAASHTIARGAFRNGSYLEEDVYRAFVSKYEEFKRKDGLIDYTDMLAFAYLEMGPLDDVKHVIVDEVQDCAPILYGIVYRLFENAETIWLVGDVNQCIYSFAGADPRLFLDRMNSAFAKVILRKTHRFGQEIVDFSTKIIERAQDKFVVDLIGVPNKEHEIRLTGTFEPSVEPMFILHRHVMGCKAVGDLYMAAGLPFRSERGRDPLGYGNRIRAFKTIGDLVEGKIVPIGAVARILDMMPMTTKPEAGEKGTRLVVHGAKRRVQEGLFQEELSIQTLVSSKILTQDGANVIRDRQYGIFEHSEDLEYYQRVIDRGYSLEGDKIPVITTIHGSKGRQAPKVVVFSEMGRKCWADPDTEHRLAYVASTRTQGAFEICGERTLDWAEAPYNYPTKDADAVLGSEG